MSATNTATTSPDRCWDTPAWLVRGLLHHCPFMTEWVVEPCAGRGAICAALRDSHHVSAIEQNPAHLRGLERICLEDRLETGAIFSRKGHVQIGDCLQMDFRPNPTCEYSIVANPPWSPAKVGLAHVGHYLTQRNCADVAALLPVQWLSGGSGRRDFWPEVGRPSATGFSLTGLLWTDHRPRFANGQAGRYEVAWFVFKRGVHAKTMAMIRQGDFE